MIKYQSEIDGLRAIATISVVCFHANLPGFSGGYTGVDVFFVISGYLITKQIIKEISENTFKVLNFYLRRMQRLAPTLLLVTTVCSPIAFVFLLPDEIRRYFHSVIAALLFSSNIYFFLKADYFAPATGDMPLIHTWSLGIEEQFYFFFPLFFIFILKRDKKILFTALTIIIILSFLGALLALENNREAAFYLLPFRAWEFLAGSIVAIYFKQLNAFIANELFRKLLVFIGLTLLIIPIILFDNTTRFPGASALPSVIGTCIVIAYCRASLAVTALLSSNFLKPVGRSSYAIYLWHQPIFTYSHILGLASGNKFGIALAAVSVGLGFVTTVLFEDKIRSRSIHEFFGPAKVIAGFTFFVVVASGVIASSKEIRSSLGRSALQEKFRSQMELTIPNCKFSLPCKIGDQASEDSIMLLGDSYAQHLVHGLDVALRQLNLSGSAIVAPGCPPILGLSVRNSSCTESLWTTAFETATKSNAKKIILYGSIGKILTLDATANVLIFGSPLASKEQVRSAFLDGIARLSASGKTVIVIGQQPTFDRIRLREILIDASDNFISGHYGSDMKYRFYNREIIKLLENSKSYFVDSGLEICSINKCRPYSETLMIYRDESHFTNAGSELFVKGALIPYLSDSR